MKKAIIFDMDGVLVESAGVVFKSFNKVLEKYDVEIIPGDRARYLGRSLRDQLSMWKEDYPKIPRELTCDEFSKEALGYQLEMMEERLKPDDVILKFIDDAKKQGLKTAVATSSVRRRAEIFLEKRDIINRLDALVACEDVCNHKPHPDIFLEAAKKINVDPAECIVIEDAVNGIEAANKAGMTSVAKLNKFHTEEEFSEANYVFSDFKDLKLEDISK